MVSDFACNLYLRTVRYTSEMSSEVSHSLHAQYKSICLLDVSLYRLPSRKNLETRAENESKNFQIKSPQE